MWETYGMDNEDLLWASTAFQGGIAGQRQAVCGTISSGAVCLGLRHRCSLKETEKAKQARQDIRRKAGELVKSFAEKFGSIICRELMGIDGSDPEALRRFRESGMFEKKCNSYVRFVVEKLYELDQK
jgi:C_GCAxxG_C_C family probable redox protein